MNQSMKLTKKEADPFLQAAGIEYSGRKISIEFAEKVSFYNTNWDGGTKNYYYTLSMATGDMKMVRVHAPWCNPIEGQSTMLPEKNLVIVHSFFCGQDCGIRIYANPSLAPKWLKG